MSVISGCGMLIIGVVKFSARNGPGINFRKVGNYGVGQSMENSQSSSSSPASDPATVGRRRRRISTDLAVSILCE